jgi:hypothetical protein
MSLFKEPFNPNIVKQLEERQKLIGTITRSTQLNRNDVALLNSKTAWIKLYSSVDFTYDGVKDASGAAKNNVLLGGRLYENTSRIKKTIATDNDEGIYDYETINNSTGITSANLLGRRPMPGINNISIQSKSAYGSLRQATVNFQCWDVEQLNILEALYMRPGYTVLLEWGWYPYMSNDGKISLLNWEDKGFFDRKNIDVQEYLLKLRQRSINSHGNYDSMFGYIKNYSWKLRNDGGYDCMTEIISTGELLESYKINFSGASISTNSTGTLLSNTEYDHIKEINKEYRRNTLAGLLAETYALAKENAGVSSMDIGNDIVAVVGINPDRFTTINPSSGVIPYTSIDNKTGDIYYATKEIELEKEGWLATDSEANDGKKATEGFITDDDSNVYITLRSFVELLNNFILLENPDSSKTDRNIIKLSVDDRPDSINANQSLRCLYNPLQISVDPRVCIIRNNLFEPLIQGINIVDNPQETPQVIQTIDPKTTAAQFEPIIKQLKDIRAKDSLGGGLEQEFKNALAKIKTKEELAGISDYYYNKYNQTFYRFLINDDLKSSSLTEFNVDDVFVGLGLTYEDVKYFENDFLRIINGALTTSSAIFRMFTDIDPFLRKKRAISSAKNQTEEQQETLDEAKEEINSNEEGYLSFCNRLSQAYHTSDTSINYGVHGNIFLNLRMLYNLAGSEELEGQDPAEKQSISLMSYLKDVLTMVQNSIGNVNNFEVVIDGNVGYIIDLNYVSPDDKQTPFVFSINDNTSIVRDISLESQIFSDQSTIIAVAAQSDAGKLGLENSSMVAYNQGVKDRNISRKDTPINRSKTDNDQLQGFITALYDLSELFNSMDKMLGFFDSELLVDSIPKYKKSLTDIIVFFTSYFAAPNKYRALLPTKLSLTIDGIGGLIIGNVFDIDKKFTPRSYTGDLSKYGVNLLYTVTNIKHDIGSNGQWTTTIDANPFIGDPVINDLNAGKQQISTNITLNKVYFYDESTGQVISKIETSDTLNLNPNRIGEYEYPGPPEWKKFGYQNAAIDIEKMVGVQIGGGGARPRYTYRGTKNWVLLHPEAAAQYVKWQEQAKKDGISFSISSGYRDLAHQGEVKKVAGEAATEPGSSPHGWGTAIDISGLKAAAGDSTAPGPNANVRKTNPLYQWLAKNGPDYGWYNPYRLADGKSQEECWHWEYWGFWAKPKK